MSRSPTRKKREKPLTSKVKPGAKRRVEPKDVDEAFLTDGELARREAFVQAYCAHGSLKKAAELAGYGGNDNSLRKQGWRLINEPAVKARIDQLRADLIQELQITQRAVLAEYKRIAFFDIGQCFDESGNLLPMSQIPEDARRALAGFEFIKKEMGSGEDAMMIEERKVKATSKTDALAKLGAHLGMFKSELDRGGIDPELFLQVMLEGRNRAMKERGQRGGS